MKIDRQNKPQLDQYQKLKWLIFFRGLFAAVLLGSAVFVGFHENRPFFSQPLIFICYIAVALLILSALYAFILPRLFKFVRFGYIQIFIDSLLITCIIFVTGSFSSIFSFLYLVVIIYAGMVLSRSGGMFIAFCCSVQYGVLIALEFQGVIYPVGVEVDFIFRNYNWNYVLYKLFITIVACFGVAFLSGFLAEQERRAKKELWAMEDQVKRVEKLAAIGEMASGLAHEIKNPLASLSGSIQFLREDIPYDPDRDRLMDIILREADRLTALVNDFLMFAKPQPGQTKIVELDVALEEIINVFTTDNRRNKRINVTQQLAEGIFIEIDPEHLRQVVWNLLLNADEAIESEGQIDIKMYPVDKIYVCITISDNGCGMTEETMESIFDPFFTAKPKGTGLGLSIVQRIITSYNGLIDVQSSPEKGTTFNVKFRREINSRPVSASGSV
ncbi:MAG: GHKL domain-containing protein [Desulfobacteraceae bacterium]|nr:GHKL domain-containing protein [Desulfobacteraceae bacterium]MBC2755318.1 GHKL domain-containing protein [Desulfobacteraceae bacterium]